MNDKILKIKSLMAEIVQILDSMIVVEEKPLTQHDLKLMFQSYMEKNSKDAAIEILNNLGVKKVSEITSEELIKQAVGLLNEKA